MYTGSLKLDSILDIPKWQTLQDSLAHATGLAIITVDYKGVPVTQHSYRRPFCAQVREDPKLGQFCQKCDARGGLEAVRAKQPYVYLCHCHIVDIAIPILVDETYIGAVMAGQVRLQNSGEEKELEKILHSPNNMRSYRLDWQKWYDAIPTKSLSELQISVQMISNLCQYIVDEAQTKQMVLDLCKKTLAGDCAPVFPQKDATLLIERVRQDFNNVAVDAQIHALAEKNICANQMLQPAFDHMETHKGEMLSQKKAAALCNVSAGHFSRVFIRETGECYNHYHMRQKVEHAKQLLQMTDLPIMRIGNELGFSDPGYFIKIFRKYEGVTPAAYRKYADTIN